jgi:hypothetical protein
LWPEDQFLLLGLPLFLGRDVKHRRLTFSQFSTSYTHTLALGLFCPHIEVMSTRSMYSKSNELAQTRHPAPAR